MRCGYHATAFTVTRTESKQSFQKTSGFAEVASHSAAKISETTKIALKY